MSSSRAPTNRRRYSVELRLYDTSNNDDNPDLVLLTNVPLSTIHLWIAEFGSSMGMRPSLSYLNIHPSPTANLSSTTERSMIYDRGHPSTTFLSDNRIRVEQGLHSRHCKPCFESGFRASSKKPIRTHLKKYHAEDFKVAPVTQSSPDRYRCCETEFDIESWADHVVDHHCYFANTAASSRLDHSQSSSSFRYASTPASSSTSEDTGSPYQVTLGSSTIGQSGYGKVLTPMSQSQPPLVPPYLLQTLTPITPSDNAHDRQLPFAGDASGNVLFDHLDNRIVRTCDWQQAFALDGTGNLVRDRCGVPIPISPGQLLYAYSDSGDRLTYHYGIDVL